MAVSNSAPVPFYYQNFQPFLILLLTYIELAFVNLIHVKEALNENVIKDIPAGMFFIF